MSTPKWLPSWLFYDAAGSRLFDQITHIAEYYVTRTERTILADHAAEIVSRAAGENSLRLVELGAGSADKTRLLLSAAVDRQDTVFYEPVDVSASALVEAQIRIENEIPGVLVRPRVQDYTQDLELDATLPSERRLVLYIDRASVTSNPASLSCCWSAYVRLSNPVIACCLESTWLRMSVCCRRLTMMQPE